MTEDKLREIWCGAARGLLAAALVIYLLLLAFAGGAW